MNNQEREILQQVRETLDSYRKTLLKVADIVYFSTGNNGDKLDKIQEAIERGYSLERHVEALAALDGVLNSWKLTENATQEEEIRMLRRELYSLQSQQPKEWQWIRTDQRIPDPHRIVIVPGGIAVWTGSVWLSKTGDDSNRVIEWPVRYWMPLPKPPSEQNTAPCKMNQEQAQQMEDWIWKNTAAASGMVGGDARKGAIGRKPDADDGSAPTPSPATLTEQELRNTLFRVRGILQSDSKTMVNSIVREITEALGDELPVKG